MWVHFDDLPEATRDALWEKHRSELAFPAGLLLPLRSALTQSPKDDDGFAVYGNDQGELGIVGEGCFVQARIEQAPKLIEKLRTILREVGSDGA